MALSGTAHSRLLSPFHSRPHPRIAALRRIFSESLGSLLMSGVLFQIFLLRTTIEVRVGCTIVLLAVLTGTGWTLRRILAISAPVAAWVVVMIVFALLSGRDLSAAVRFFLAIYPLILSAALILVLATPVTIIRFISCAAAKSRVLPVTTLLLVAGAFLESLVSAEAILRECLVAGRVRRGGAQISVYGAALRQALLLLLLQPEARARVYVVRRPFLLRKADCPPCFRHFAIPAALSGIVVIQEVFLRWL